MPFDDRLDKAVRAGDEAEVRRLLAGAGRAKLAELALTQRLPEWLAALVRQEKDQREQKAAAFPASRGNAAAGRKQLRAGGRLSPARGQSSCAVLEAERPGTPAWLDCLAGIVDSCLVSPGWTDKPSFHCREAEGGWEVLVYPAPAEPATALSLDLRRLQAAFRRVDGLCWNTRSTGDEGPCLCIEGLIQGHEVRLRVFVCPPGREGPTDLV
jgi:hypothetical protein